MANSFVFLKDKNLKPENIKKGVKIFKTEGTFEGGASINNQDKTVNASTSEQTITADQGYTGLGTVTVNAAPLQNRTVDASTVQIDVQRASNDYYGLRHVYINPVDASIDSNIQAGNIKFGVTILGVTGTYSPLFTVCEYEDADGWIDAWAAYSDGNGISCTGAEGNNNANFNFHVYSDSSVDFYIDGDTPEEADLESLGIENLECSWFEELLTVSFSTDFENTVTVPITFDNGTYTQDWSIEYTAGAEGH